MDYEKYLEEIKGYIKKSTKKQRVWFVVGLLVVLGVVIVAINPAKKMLEMRNSQRRSDVVNILNSVYQYSIDHPDALPESITAQPTMICKSTALSCDGLVDISKITGDKKYLLSKVPVDPKEKNVNSSGYQISKLANGRISVSAPLAENNAVINLSK
ncbi:MAG TPA: hypothetical protein DEA43_04285 [Candidatus Moranbacteria bacterium]|nr:hypothetical protein [Candidatus Moranbacteria bacterium]HBT46072.1 hypothetical protein [Candidatus Moranbacteria bacterium]